MKGRIGPILHMFTVPTSPALRSSHDQMGIRDRAAFDSCD
jgi:hypothetical protein